ncbi:hypothetical protein L1987_72921 [Smallanthus sonchifolius]|uniref:Uncharacterized protein n=1 Tax=Smallanthus sonchifolius TaxID=185202 RepID=A0ACB9AXE1_9ASTR|nr:hypothetical protein L1987_72921 [Smallanthus sonchifolius]
MGWTASGLGDTFFTNYLPSISLLHIIQNLLLDIQIDLFIGRSSEKEMKTKIRVYKPASSQENQHFAQKVGDNFIKKYYKVLHRRPEETYKFYKDESTLSRPRDNGTSNLVTTIKEIKKEIMQSDMSKATIVLLDMHAQDTIAKSVIVGVIGLVGKENMLKCFSQTFLLAPHATGFYVQNDLLKYLNIPNDTEYYLVSIEDHKGISSSDDINEISAHVQNNVQSNTQSSVNTHEDVSKLSYASIVGKAISQPVPTLASAQVLSDKSSTNVPPTTQSAASRIGKTILVKNLPPQVTRKSLTQAFKGCGPIRHRNIQIRGYHDGYRYAFVEFNNPRAAQQAVKAGSITFDGWECQVEHKKGRTEQGDNDKGGVSGNDDGVGSSSHFV